MSRNDVLFEETRKRNAQDLLRLGIDESGYVEGKIFMIWPSRNGVRRINIETTNDSGIHRFEVDILSKFLEGRGGLALRPHDYIRIALKGASVELRKESSAPHYIPVLLKFTGGVAIECLSGVHKGVLINTWEEGPDSSEWYDRGAVQRVSEVAMNDAYVTVATQHLPGPPTLVQPHALPQCQNSLHNRSSDIHPQPSDSMDPRTTATLSKAQKRRRKRRVLNMLASGTGVTREAVAGHPHDLVTPPVIAYMESGPSYQTQHVAPPQVQSNGSTRQTSDSTATPVSLADIGVSVSDSVNGRNVEQLDSSSCLQGGIRTEMGDLFTAIKDLRKATAMINIIGVVTSVQAEKRTSTKEWSRSFTVVDPSIVEQYQSITNGIKVNCFQKKYVEWLPQVNQGDVVILRKLKIAEWEGKLSAIGFGDKLRWAIYDSVTHGIRCPNKGEAPDGEGSDNGFGYYYSPYWTPTANGAELAYCVQITAWWKAFEERGTSNVVAVQFQASKVHRLLSEVSPNLAPQGFFNCTVEILQKFENDSGPYTVYATDYTTNPHVCPIRATWCRSELQDHAFRFEMWDAARDIARIMSPGEYWYFHNVRAKWDGNHYLQGTMQKAEKVRQLDEAQLESLPHLGALLARKRELNEGFNKPKDPSNAFPSTLFQDVDQKTVLFTCTVELLHVDFDSRDDPSIYVTDYTFRHDLPTCLSTAEWCRGLDHRIVRIKLDDSQARKARALQLGSFYKIVNLRLIQMGNVTNTYGRLGGEDRLIFPLHDLSSECGQMLKRNKEQWAREMMLEGMPIATASANGLHVPSSKSGTRVDSCTIQQVLSSSVCPDKFTVVARVVDFFPFHLEDACVLRCTKCELDVPRFLQGCLTCDNMMETRCKWFYCLYLRLQDDEDKDITVSLCGKECSFLQDVEPADFRYDAAAFARFLAKVRLVLGNLRDVHEAWSQNRDKDVESPTMYFTLESWSVQDGRGYGLLDCTPL